jgi:putative glutamine amidotransferase
MRPRIGLLLTLDAAGKLRRGRETWYADAAVAAAIEASGGACVALAAGGSAADASLDGLVIPGGGDFLPASPYPPEIAFRPVAAAQLAAETALAAAGLERGLPILGICYGMQLLARVAGGALVYDLPHELPDADRHQLAGEERHAIAVTGGSRLSALLGGATSLRVNSRHHQAVAKPGPGLRVCATSADGVIEAIESPPGAPFALGVQWHPEDMDAEHRDRIYGGLVAAARAQALSAPSTSRS